MMPEPDQSLHHTIIRLLKRRPFYGHLLLGLYRNTTWGKEPAVSFTEGTPTLHLNPTSFSRLPPEIQDATLEHLLVHLLLLHPIRGAGKNSSSWGLASDLAVNELLQVGGPSPADLGLPPSLTAEAYYDQLHNRFDLGSLEGDGFGRALEDMGGLSGDGAAASPHRLDSHAPWSEQSTPQRLAEHTLASLVQQALDASRDLPAELSRQVATLLQRSRIPWQEILHQFIGTAGRVGRRLTWSRPHRRFGPSTPGVRKRQRLRLLIGIDVSESTDQQQTREAFADELLRIARARETELTVVYANSTIRKVERFRQVPQVREVYRGGGFTDLRPLFDFARTLSPPPAAIIYLTDGEGPAPEHTPFPTLWVTPPGCRPPVPWGIHLILAEGERHG